jgi:hypothetical protein
MHCLSFVIIQLKAAWANLVKQYLFKVKKTKKCTIVCKAMHFAGELYRPPLPPIIYTVIAFKRAKIELRGGGPTTIDTEWTMLFGTAMGPFTALAAPFTAVSRALGYIS